MKHSRLMRCLLFQSHGDEYADGYSTQEALLLNGNPQSGKVLSEPDAGYGFPPQTKSGALWKDTLAPQHSESYLWNHTTCGEYPALISSLVYCASLARTTLSKREAPSCGPCAACQIAPKIWESEDELPRIEFCPVLTDIRKLSGYRYLHNSTLEPEEDPEPNQFATASWPEHASLAPTGQLSMTSDFVNSRGCSADRKIGHPQ